MTNKVYQELIDHCKKDYPIEACGLVSGSASVIKTLWEMNNVHRSRTSFCMNKNEIKNVFKRMELINEQFMGIYHSHPSSGPYPSPEDILYHNYPDVGYIIVSLAHKRPVVKAFKIQDRKVNPLTLIVK